MCLVLLLSACGRAGSNNERSDGTTQATGGGGGAAPATDAGDTEDAAGGSSSTVRGEVVDMSGEPAANVTVIIDGQKRVTDANGNFVYKDAPTSYNATILSNGPSVPKVFLGVTTRTPRFVVRGPAFSATISGSLSGGAGFPNDETHLAQVAFGYSQATGSVWLGAGEGPDYGPLEVEGYSADPARSRLHALQFQVDANWLPTAYTGWADKPLDVNNGSNILATDLELADVDERVLVGTIRGADSLPITKVIRVGFLSPVYDETPQRTYRYWVPSGLGLPLYLQVRATDGSQQSQTWLPFDDTTSQLDLELRDPPVQLTPVASATDVWYGTPFQFTDSPDSIYVVSFSDWQGDVLWVYTTRTTISIPDLTDAGIELKKGSIYVWQVLAYSPHSSLDEWVDPSIPWTSQGKSYDTVSTARRFTTAP